MASLSARHPRNAKSIRLFKINMRNVCDVAEMQPGGNIYESTIYYITVSDVSDSVKTKQQYETIYR